MDSHKKYLDQLNPEDLLKHHTKSIEELFVTVITDVHEAHKHKQHGESKKVAQRNETLDALRKYKEILARDPNAMVDTLISRLVNIFKEDL